MSKESKEADSNETNENEEAAKPELKYPKAIFFIIGNEFCERFTYYGLRTVLIIFLTQRLYYSESTGTMIYHMFALLAYFTPVLGAFIADSFLGKYNTILYLSILYCIGGIVLSFGAFPNELTTMKIISLIGLAIIGFGTGGIKPCVSAFGGDQFKTGQEKQLQQFFSYFYMSINVGSLLSTYLTPLLRAEVHCFGENTCFTLAFGVPAILMIVALLLFVCGKSLYVIRPPEGNIVYKVSKCICYAIGRKFKSTEKKKSHWLDYAEDKYDKKLISDIKILFHVLVLYIPLPVFWALFDQQGSRWTLQATRLDGQVGSFHIKADQMQVLNPLLIIVFIPLFDYLIYPLLRKCRLLTKPLQRITTGGILAALSFVIAGFIQLRLETAYPILPDPGTSDITIINNAPCSIRIGGTNISSLNAFNTIEHRGLQLDQSYTWNLVPEDCNVSSTPLDFSFNSSEQIESMMITTYDGNVVAIKVNDTKEKSHDGEPQIRVFYNFERPSGNVSIKFEDKDAYTIYLETNDPYGITEYLKLPPGDYKVYLPLSAEEYEPTEVTTVSLHSGGVYILTIYNKTDEAQQIATLYEMVKGNFLSIFYQVPPYVILTAGEIMFSITGLEFSYSQSPTSMKSVVQAAWLLTVAFGNLIVLVIAKLELFEKQSHELFLFAVLMGVDMVIFAILAYFYKYVKIKTPSEEEVTEPPMAPLDPPRGSLDREKGVTNDAYVDETELNK